MRFLAAVVGVATQYSLTRLVNFGKKLQVVRDNLKVSIMPAPWAPHRPGFFSASQIQQFAGMQT
jgi:hypothetical protein